jgi:hypothetical protein
MHGLVLLRMNVPHFPWPAPLNDMVDNLVARVIQLNRPQSNVAGDELVKHDVDARLAGHDVAVMAAPAANRTHARTVYRLRIGLRHAVVTAVLPDVCGAGPGDRLSDTAGVG